VDGGSLAGKDASIVRVALAPDLAVGDDVEAGILLGSNRDQGRIILRLREKRLGNSPQLFRADARRKAPGEFRAIDEPIWLRLAAYKRGRKQDIGIVRSGRRWRRRDDGRALGTGARPSRPGAVMW
jgi:hypothetical protein